MTASPLPAIPRAGALYLLVLFVLALGFYALLLGTLAALAYAVYLLVLYTPDLIRPGTIRALPLLGAVYIGLGILILATLRGFTARAGGMITGIHAHRGHHQKLFTLVREVAEKVGAKPLNEIILTPGVSIGVMEEAAIWMPPGLGKRRLIVGMALLGTQTTDQLRSILAHEFAHFSHGDTFLVRRIYQIEVAFEAVLNEMARVRFYWLNPCFWVLALYFRFYMLVAASFDRLQELRADRFAVNAYGRERFSEALSTNALEMTLFEMFGAPHFDEMARGRGGYDNLYHTIGLLRRQLEIEQPGVPRKILGEILAQKTGVYDRHPSLSERLRKQNIASALIKVVPLPALPTRALLTDEAPPDLLRAAWTGPVSAAEEFFGDQVIPLQRDLTRMAGQSAAAAYAEWRAAQAAAMDG
jgi:Zn-dependent protease with chaperone function